MSEFKKLLALDQASKVSGYAVFDQDGSLISYGKISVDGEPIDRIIELRNKVEQIIDHFEIDEVVIEDVYYSETSDNPIANVETFKILCFTMAGLLFMLTEKDIPHTIMNATTWKSLMHVTGKDRVNQKRSAQKVVENEFGIKVIQDISDAVCIGGAHLKKKHGKESKKGKGCKSDEKDLLYFD